MCKVLKVSRIGYYAWLKITPSKRSLENDMLIDKIRKIYRLHKGIYGSPRITKELLANQISISRPRVARLMRKAGLKSIVQRKFVTTTNSKHHHPVAENVLNRDFRADKKAQKWVLDITYIRTRQGWLYLTIIMDLADRKVIGWATSKTMETKNTIVSAWKMAIANRPIHQELIFHSDQGIQYASNEFRSILSATGKVTQSMSRRGNCWDNAVAESFFKSLKTEWVYHYKYQTRDQARLSLFEYIETYYNTRRRHSKLGYLTPLEFEIKLDNNNRIAA
ncbi:Transposase InsO and inactivated derivatives [Pustulibacterium marinum]|uniref:Transposase InsO and inactivated derivatives n=2 Tax=Pustulibacterium marinum TaxID=1224947 RepID=A0A1I7IBT1_9FLAO|nr:Transposase InsO and inactivated derivatives [Pustulibacterium marinum]